MDEEAGQVAIVGMAVLLPGADSLEAYWENLASGYDAITDTPPGRWEPEFYDPQSKEPDRVYCRRGAFLDMVEFDPLQRSYDVDEAGDGKTSPSSAKHVFSTPCIF